MSPSVAPLCDMCDSSRALWSRGVSYMCIASDTHTVLVILIHSLLFMGFANNHKKKNRILPDGIYNQETYFYEKIRCAAYPVNSSGSLNNATTQ